MTKSKHSQKVKTVCFARNLHWWTLFAMFTYFFSIKFAPHLVNDRQIRYQMGKGKSCWFSQVNIYLNTRTIFLTSAHNVALIILNSFVTRAEKARDFVTFNFFWAQYTFVQKVQKWSLLPNSAFLHKRQSCCKNLKEIKMMTCGKRG